MKLYLSIYLLFYLAISSPSFAQQTLPIPSSIQEAYNKETRNINGKPGSKYWQNKAEYNLKINFEPSTRIIKGIVDVVYFNNSPDTLKQLWFKLYPNLYKNGVKRKAEIDSTDIGTGLNLVDVEIDGYAKPLGTLSVDGTNMFTPINALAPGKSIKLKITYNYILNKGSSVRTGQVDESSFFIAYFFPRIAVYDDIDGWNKYEYDGEAEFYNDFSDFEVAITVPKNFIVWATGDLVNIKTVFRKNIVNRLNKAQTSDKIIDVVTVDDLKKGKVTTSNPFITWKFEVQNITDFSFAVSDHYVVKSSSLVVDSLTGKRTRVDAVFNPEHKEYEEIINFSKKTINAMSYNFPNLAYPYSHITVFDGLDEMEYPMMANINPIKNRYDAITTVSHEIFHNMFPFYVGINETKYGWMDEGWAAVAEWFIAPLIDSTFVGGAGVNYYSDLAGSDKPIVSISHDLEGTDYISNTYVKPNLAYYYLVEYLGKDLFTKAFKHYIDQWKGKHPTPFDFFYSMNEGAGKNLDWFWKRWFFDESSVDMAIQSVTKEIDGFSIQIENIGGKPLPILLTCNYTDDSIEKIQKNIDVWNHDDTITTIKLKTSKNLQKVTLGSVYIPDKNKANNVFVVK